MSTGQSNRTSPETSPKPRDIPARDNNKPRDIPARDIPAGRDGVERREHLRPLLGLLAGRTLRRGVGHDRHDRVAGCLRSLADGTLQARQVLVESRLRLLLVPREREPLGPRGGRCGGRVAPALARRCLSRAGVVPAPRDRGHREYAQHPCQRTDRRPAALGQRAAAYCTPPAGRDSLPVPSAAKSASSRHRGAARISNQ